MLFLIPWSSAGSLPSIGKLTHSQSSFHLGAPCSPHLVPSIGLRSDAQPPSHNNIKCCCLLWACCSDTILLCLGSIFWTYELVTSVNEFIWAYRSLPVTSFSECQYPALRFPGLFLHQVDCSSLWNSPISSWHSSTPWESCHFMMLSFCPHSSPELLDLTSIPGLMMTGSTNPIQNHLLARVPYHLVLNT